MQKGKYKSLHDSHYILHDSYQIDRRKDGKREAGGIEGGGGKGERELIRSTTLSIPEISVNFLSRFFKKREPCKEQSNILGGRKEGKKKVE